MFIVGGEEAGFNLHVGHRIAFRHDPSAYYCARFEYEIDRRHVFIGDGENGGFRPAIAVTVILVHKREVILCWFGSHNIIPIGKEQ